MNLKILATASVLAVAAMVGSVSAATLSGTFKVTAVNVTNLNSTESQATLTNLRDAALGDLGGTNSLSKTGFFNYTGALDFREEGPHDELNPYTIGDWLSTGTGTVDNLAADVADLQLSSPDLIRETATTTFFFFQLQELLTPGSFTVTHADGLAVFDNDDPFNPALLGGDLGPTDEVTTTVEGFDGGKVAILYVATNGNPSILETTTTATVVPLPAGGLLLLTGLGAFVLAARRRRAAA